MDIIKISYYFLSVLEKKSEFLFCVSVCSLTWQCPNLREALTWQCPNLREVVLLNLYASCAKSGATTVLFLMMAAC